MVRIYMCPLIKKTTHIGVIISQPIWLSAFWVIFDGDIKGGAVVETGITILKVSVLRSPRELTLKLDTVH